MRTLRNLTGSTIFLHGTYDTGGPGSPEDQDSMMILPHRTADAYTRIPYVEMGRWNPARACLMTETGCKVPLTEPAPRYIWYLPEPTPNVAYIVDRSVFDALLGNPANWREDIYAPHGLIIGPCSVYGCTCRQIDDSIRCLSLRTFPPAPWTSGAALAI